MISTSWKETRALFAELYAPPMRSKNTASTIRWALHQLERFAPAGPGSIHTGTIARMTADQARHSCGVTVNSLLRSSKVICAKLKALGALQVNPFDVQSFSVRPSRSQRVNRRWQSLEEIGRVLDLADAEAAADPLEPVLAIAGVKASKPSAAWKAARRRALVYVLSYGGLRAGEALHLRPNDCALFEADGRGGSYSGVWIRSDENGEWLTKTEAAEAPVPIGAEAALVLRDWLPHCGGRWVFPTATRRERPWTGGSKGAKPLDEIRALGERAGVPGMTLLGLRHSFATNARTRWGLSRDQVRMILRHTKESTQDRFYVHRELSGLAGMLEPVKFPTRKGAGHAAIGLNAQ